MSAAIPVVAIGAGRVAHAAHLRELRALDDQLRLAAVVEVDGARLDALRSAFAGVMVCATVEEAVRAGARAALCLTPWWTHRDVTEECLRLGLPVLCEKPVSLDPMDIDALMDAEKRSGVPVSVGYMKRHDPIVARFVRHIREHAGTARRISVTINDPNSPEQIEHLLPRFVSGVRRYSPDQAAAVERALGPDAHPVQREVYARGLGGSLIHQVNIVQEALSWHGLELLNRLRLCSQWARGTAVACQWQPADGLMVEMSHARLPEHRTYRERIECVGERSVATLRMPSPYSRDLGASLDIDTWDATGVCRSDRFTAVPGRTGFRMQLRSWAKSLAGDPDVAMPGLSEARRDVEILREAALAVS